MKLKCLWGSHNWGQKYHRSVYETPKYANELSKISNTKLPSGYYRECRDCSTIQYKHTQPDIFGMEGWKNVS